MITAEKFYGGSQFITAGVAGSYDANGAARVITVQASVVGVTLQLPPVSEISNARIAGGPVFFVINSGTQTLTVRDAAGVNFTVAPATAAPVGFESGVMLPKTSATPTTAVEDAFIVGGGAMGAESAVSRRFVYSTEIISTDAAMPSARAEGAACAARQTFYVAQTRGGSDLANKYALGVWSGLPNLSSAREDGVAEFDGDRRALFFGGDDGASEGLDVITDTWSALSALPLLRAEGSSAPWPGGDRVIIISGDDPAKIALAYHVPTDTYETLDPYLSDPRRNHTAIPHDGRVMVIGGEQIASGDVLAAVDLYDPVARVWSVGPSLPAARTDAGSWAAGDFSGYCGGGLDDALAAANEVYRLRGRGAAWSTITATLNVAFITNQCAGGVL